MVKVVVYMDTLLLAFFFDQSIFGLVITISIKAQ